MKRYLPFIIVVGVALATFGSGAMLYHAKHPQLQAIPEDKAVPANSGNESMHIRGNPDAPVTLEEFGDFQRPPCGSFAAFAQELLKKNMTRACGLSFGISRSTVHEHAREAAMGACGSRRDPRSFLGDVRRALSRTGGLEQGSRIRANCSYQYAGTIGLNVDQFKKGHGWRTSQSASRVRLCARRIARNKAHSNPGHQRPAPGR